MDTAPRSGFLHGHTLVDTRSPDEARQEIGRIFCPHFLSPGSDGDFHAVHRSARRNGFSLNFVSYGSAVDIDPGELSRFFLLQIPLAGSASVRCGRETALVAPGRTASLLSPTLPTAMRWSAGCDKLIVLIDRDSMRRQCEALADRSAGDVEFSTGIDTAGGPGRILLDHVRLMLESVEAGGALADAYLGRLGENLNMLLLTGFAHSLRALIDRPAAEAGSGPVARAEEWIRANIAGSFTAADVARASGTSLRSLQEGLRRQKGTTLTQLIETVRLESFRAALADPAGSRSVTEAALAAGLGHLGRAAGAYRARFGETPVETLRRRR